MSGTGTPPLSARRWGLAGRYEAPSIWVGQTRHGSASDDLVDTIHDLVRSKYWELPSWRPFAVRSSGGGGGAIERPTGGPGREAISFVASPLSSPGGTRWLETKAQ